MLGARRIPCHRGGDDACRTPYVTPYLDPIFRGLFLYHVRLLLLLDQLLNVELIVVEKPYCCLLLVLNSNNNNLS